MVAAFSKALPKKPFASSFFAVFRRLAISAEYLALVDPAEYEDRFPVSWDVDELLLGSGGLFFADPEVGSE